jgi:DNA-binding NarL/FixJ family response regulator
MKKKRTEGDPVAKKRILLVDDHPIMRHGLSQLIRAAEELEVCGEAGSAREGLDKVLALKPDLVVVDLTLPDKSGLELLKDIQAMVPGMTCLVLSMHDESLYAERVLRAGARGYLMKETAAENLITAIRKVSPEASTSANPSLPKCWNSSPWAAPSRRVEESMRSPTVNSKCSKPSVQGRLPRSSLNSSASAPALSKLTAPTSKKSSTSPMVPAWSASPFSGWRAEQAWREVTAHPVERDGNGARMSSHRPHHFY